MTLLIVQMGRKPTADELRGLAPEKKRELVKQRMIIRSLYQHTQGKVKWELLNTFVDARNVLSKTKDKNGKKAKKYRKIMEDAAAELQNELAVPRLYSILLTTHCDICPC